MSPEEFVLRFGDALDRPNINCEQYATLERFILSGDEAIGGKHARAGENMKDSIGDRFKDYYENRTRVSLPRRTYYIIRVDGRAFHSFTKNFARPFDDEFMQIMNETAISMCENIQGVKLAYVQSDEISLLLTDFDEIGTNAWFDGNIQKITSISASIATVYFNRHLQKHLASCYDLAQMKKMGKFLDKNGEQHIAMFDSRVFTIPECVEVENYFIWRQQDASRNSVQMAAQTLYSHKQLHGKNSSQLQDLMHEKGINWNDYPVRCKRGGTVVKGKYEKDGSERTRWVMQDPPIFTQDREYLRNLIPIQSVWDEI